MQRDVSNVVLCDPRVLTESFSTRYSSYRVIRFFRFAVMHYTYASEITVAIKNSDALPYIDMLFWHTDT